ncbi:MAG: hypothetical protein IJS71_08455 [Clostridia bacterium]|nr:hypothetical protein [Clostridia bacterium]
MIGLNVEMTVPEKCVDCALYNDRTKCCHVLNQWCALGIEKLPNCPLVGDVEPIKHAYWKDCEINLFDGIDEYETYRCSECTSLSFRRSKYCPECGARMEEEK